VNWIALAGIVDGQNPFPQHRRYPLLGVVQSQTAAAGFSLNNRQVGLQVIRFGAYY